MDRVELDHIFVPVALGGEDDARAMREAGLTEGSPNVHPGQGTACRRFFFENGFVELLWLVNEEEARSPHIRRMGLVERLTQHQASPLGIALRCPPDARDALPYPCWDYRPPYLPEGMSIPVAEASDDVRLPMMFAIPFGHAPIHAPKERRQPLTHACGAVRIAHATVQGPQPGVDTPALRAMERRGLLRVASGSAWRAIVALEGVAPGWCVEISGGRLRLEAA